MIIVQFPSLVSAEFKLDEYNNLAFPDGNPNHFTLTPIFKHTTMEIWWFNGSDCIENGGLGTQEIENDIESQDIFEVKDYSELIEMGYLAPPDDN